MSPFKHLLYSLLLLLFPVSCFAQLSVSKSIIPSSATIRYSNGESPVFRNSNQVISIISEDALKNLYKTEIIINFTLTREIKKENGETHVLTLLLEKTGISGDIHYRGFDISEVLQPHRIDLSFLIGHSSDSSGYRYVEKKNIEWDPGDSLVFSMEMHPFNRNTDSVTNPTLQFFYDDAALSMFNEHIRLIDDYFASSAVLDSLMVMADKIDLSDISRYPLFFIHLREMIRMDSIIGHRLFPEKLHLDKNDPAGFIRKYGVLYKYLKSAAMTFTENLNEAEILNCPVPDDSLLAKFIEGIMRYIRWSMLVNERNGGIYKEYLENCYTGNSVMDDREVIKKILVRQHPGGNADLLFNQLIRKLMEAFKITAKKLILNYQFSGAYELLANAQRLRTAMPELFPVDDLKEIVAEASGGIYNSFLGIAGNALERNKTRMAEIYLDKARNYRSTHGEAITGDSVYRKIFLAYFLIKMEKCDVLAEGVPEAALQCLREFEQNQDEGSLAMIREELSSRRNRIINALHSDTTYREKYVKELARAIRDGRSLVWRNMFPEAKAFADSMELLVRKESLYDSLLISSLDSYRRAIDERICWNSRESFELMMIRADRFIGQKEYLRAAAFLDSAAMIAGQAGFCGIDGTPAKDTLNRYNDIIKFLKRKLLVEELVSKGNYEQAVIEFRSNTSDYITDNLQRFGVEIQRMEDFIRSKNIPDLTFSAAEYLLKLADLPGSLKFLRILRNQDFPVKRSKSIQKTLAINIAEADFMIHKKDEDPVVLSKKYSEGDNWFRSFDFWYIYRWNELRNQ